MIEKLQSMRKDHLCLVYVTSTRGNHEIAMADNVVRLIYDHLEAGKKKAKNGVDLFIHSNGGQGTVPWRIVSLIREYTKTLAVLVPHHAFSAATLLATFRCKTAGVSPVCRIPRVQQRRQIVDFFAGHRRPGTCRLLIDVID